MKQILRPSSRSALLAAAACCPLALLPACNGSGDGVTATFVTNATRHPSAASSPLVVRGPLLVYLASEALSGVGGTNFNSATGDADKADDCAVVVDMLNDTETELRVATLDVKIVGENVYLMVSESADSKDWNVDADTSDTVLLHFASGSPLDFVAEIDSGPESWAVAGARLYFARGDTSGVVAGDTGLAFLAAGAPKTPVTVGHADAGNTLFPHVLAVDEGLIFLTADETVEGRDLNGDADSNDPYVLALLDGTDVSALVQNVGLTVESDSAPVRAHQLGANDWLVGFLVDEATMDNFATGLNDPTVGSFGFGGAWKPSNCPTYADADTTDQVLHILDFSTWSANPVANPPENTGIPGEDRILATDDAVAVLVREVDDGGCDLNNDGDTSDQVLRWVRAGSPQLPFGTANQINAVEDSIPGGADGISELDDRFVAIISESDDDTDHDGDSLETHDLVAWVDPDVGTPTWRFDHGDAVGTQSVGASWFADRRERDRLLVAFQESVADQAINTGDTDKLDSIPTFARFDPSDVNDLDFPGPAVAVSANNAGMVISGGHGFYRVSEADDNRDWNGDNVKDDFVLFRTNISTNFSAQVGFKVRSTTNSLQRPVVEASGDFGAAFLSDESMAGQDLNQPPDGRSDGFCVTWFRIGS